MQIELKCLELFGKYSKLASGEVVRGIYLWTVPLSSGEYGVNYVGQSENIFERLRTEVANVLTLRWTVYNVESMKGVKRDFIFRPGWPNKSPEYIAKYYLDPESTLANHLKFLRSYHILFSQLDASVNLRQVERALTHDFRKSQGDFLDNERPSGKNLPDDYIQIALIPPAGIKFIDLSSG